MAPQLYLISPQNADASRFPPLLMSVLGVAEVSALLVSRGSSGADEYGRLATALINVGQGAGCAVLLEDEAALARRLGADGVHVTGGLAAVQQAIKAVKPAMIVGAGEIASRHDAMTLGEMDLDYLMFGPLYGAQSAADAELAEWWASTFEIPAVFSDPSALSPEARGAEFLALSDSIWSAPSPVDAMKAIAATLREVA